MTKEYTKVCVLTVLLISVCVFTFLVVRAESNNEKVLIEYANVNAENITKSDNLDYTVSVEGLTKYLRDFKNKEVQYSKIEISEMYIDDKPIYFALLQQAFFWESKLYLINSADGIISEIIDTGAGGLDLLFEYDIVDISQGKFIAAYCSSHSGNGNLELISLDELGKPQYSIPAICNYYAETEQIANEYELSSSNGDIIKASAVYIGGKLSAEYEDIDNDGNTDIVLKGVLQVYETLGNNKVLQKEYYIKNIYLFEHSSNSFVLNEILSERILLTN